MKKIMFDTNAFDLLIPELKEHSECLQNECGHTQSGENFITVEQAIEIADLPDEEMESRRQGFLRTCQERPYLDGGLTNFFEKTADLYEYYVCPMQVEELAEIPNKTNEKRETRVCDFLILCSMRPQFISSIDTADRFRLGVDRLANQEDIRIFSGITTESGNNAKDAIIAVAAEDGEIVIVTEDNGFKDNLEAVNLEYMTYSEWLDSVSPYRSGS